IVERLKRHATTSSARTSGRISLSRNENDRNIVPASSQSPMQIGPDPNVSPTPSSNRFISSFAHLCAFAFRLNGTRAPTWDGRAAPQAFARMLEIGLARSIGTADKLRWQQAGGPNGSLPPAGRSRFQIDSAGRDRVEAVPGIPAVGSTGRACWRAYAGGTLRGQGQSAIGRETHAA